MNKKISELNIIENLKNGDYLPIVDSIDGETKKVSIADIIGTSVGDIKYSMLTPTQFDEVNYGTWMLMNGQSCAGTSYATLTGNNTVPNAYTDGSFLRQAKSGVSLGTPQGDAIRNINGQFAVFPSLAGTVSGPFQKTTSGNGWGGGTASQSTTMTFNASLQVPTADENRPKNISVNIFIRVN